MVEELASFVEAVKVWPLILGAVALFSAAPQLVMELLLLLYPRDHPRRAEHRAELRAVPRWQRPFWVAETGIAVVFEAIPARRKAAVHPGWTAYSPSSWVFDFRIKLYAAAVGLVIGLLGAAVLLFALLVAIIDFSSGLLGMSATAVLMMICLKVWQDAWAHGRGGDSRRMMS